MKFALNHLVAPALLLLTTVAYSQQNTPSRVDTLAVQVKSLQDDLSALRRTRFTGFIQSQFQTIQTPGAETVAGGNFPVASDNRFSVRRARITMNHSSRNGEYVLNIDATERGVGIRDAFATFRVPGSESLSFTAGLFMRPFSHEIMESDGRRESPERARFGQVLFPTERDLGAKFTWNPSEESGWDFLTVEGGLFNGTGTNAAEFDSFKDFIGNIAISNSVSDGSIRYGLRVSGHLGGFRQANNNVWEMGILPGGLPGFVLNSDVGNLGKKAEQRLVSIDAQVSVRNPLGTTTIQGEYLTGRQPGFAGSTRTPSVAPPITADTYIRDIQGGMVKFIHRVAGTNHSAVVKYDWFDPNTDASGNHIGNAASNLAQAEIAFTNLGFGWLWDVDRNIRFTVYYDITSNETSVNLPAFAGDIKDNVLTIRMLYRL